MSIYENLNKPMSKTPTQNDWKKEFQGWAFDHDRRYFKSVEGKRLMSMISKFLADARREVIDSIHGKFCEFAIQGGDDEQAQKGILLYARTLQYLATLRKEGK